MELTQIKSLPYFGFHKAWGNIFVPVMGAILLLDVALQYSRSTEGLGRLTLAVITSGVGLIGLS